MQAVGITGSKCLAIKCYFKKYNTEYRTELISRVIVNNIFHVKGTEKRDRGSIPGWGYFLYNRTVAV